MSSRSSSEESESSDVEGTATLEKLQILHNYRKKLSGRSTAEQLRNLSDEKLTETDLISFRMTQRGQPKSRNKAMVLKKARDAIQKTEEKTTSFRLDRDRFFENIPVDDPENEFTMEKVETLLFQNTNYKKTKFTQDQRLVDLEKTYKEIVMSEGKKTPKLDPVQTLALIKSQWAATLSTRFLGYAAQEIDGLCTELLPAIKRAIVFQNPELRRAVQTLDIQVAELALAQFNEFLGKTAYFAASTCDLMTEVFSEKYSKKAAMNELRLQQILLPQSTQKQSWRRVIQVLENKTKIVKIKSRTPKLSDYEVFHSKNSKGEKNRSRKRSRSKNRHKNRQKTQHSRNRSRKRKRHSESRSRSRGRSKSESSRRSLSSRRSSSRAKSSPSRSRSNSTVPPRKRKRSISTQSMQANRSESKPNPNPAKRKKRAENQS